MIIQECKPFSKGIVGHQSKQKMVWFTERSSKWALAVGQKHLPAVILCLNSAECTNPTMDSGGKPSTAQIVVLATSSALTAVFYAIYRSRASTVSSLKVSHNSPGLLRHALLKCEVCSVWIYFLLWSEMLIPAGSEESLHQPGFENDPVWNSWTMCSLCCHRRSVGLPPGLNEAASLCAALFLIHST